ncbi:hypothetical protein C6P45_005204 [Maudiozyma exigua]|uniref:Uncharacterized protein n=1 Tax=Maudiozyma exigua TaxID=34358 RepID=A0A9P7BB08_MAUEX|nr:hypothetical protein C6P45_005204 [Kazachstania exigua]
MTSNFRIFKNTKNTQSEDFINLSEPPKPKDSPMLSFEGGLFHTDNGPNDNSSHLSRAPLLFPRRRSTNYMDALTTKEKQKNKDKLFNSVGENIRSFRKDQHVKRSQRRKSLLSGMDFQDTRHDIQTSNVTSDDNNSIGEYTTKHHDMGDYIQRPQSPEYSPVPNASLFKKQYRTDINNEEIDTSGNNQEGSDSEDDISARRPASTGRKLSFEYEDFKKDIYNKLNFFDKN